MIDWLRLSISSPLYAKSLRDNKLFKDWITYTRSKTGLKVEIAEYKGLTFKLYPSGRIEITGSLHKFWNGGEHNFNDFSVSDLQAVVSGLSKTFGSEILSMAVQNLEFGINIETPFTPSEYTDKVIVYLSRGAREKNAITKDDAKGFDKGIKFILDNYIIKLYNKSGQYLQPGNILRCEFKTVKMEIVKGAKIKTLVDLYRSDVINFLFDRLMTSMDSILINESIDTKGLTQHQKMITLECINPDYWKGISKFKRRDRKKQFEALSKQYGTTDIKAIVKDLLKAKYNILNSKIEKTCYLLTAPVKSQPSHLNKALNSLIATY